jgi:hypothetical protein
VPLARLETALLAFAGHDRYQSTIDYASAMQRRAQTLEAKLERVWEWHARFGLPQNGGDELEAILDDKEGT